MRFVVPIIVLCVALFCLWAALTGRTFYEKELLGPGKPMPSWRARLAWTLCGLTLLLAAWSMLDYSARALK